MSQGWQPPKREGGNAQRRLSTAGPAGHTFPPLSPSVRGREGWQAGVSLRWDRAGDWTGSHSGAMRTLGPEGLSEPGSIGDCWAPSPGVLWLIDSTSRGVVAWMPMRVHRQRLKDIFKHQELRLKQGLGLPWPWYHNSNNWHNNNNNNKLCIGCLVCQCFLCYLILTSIWNQYFLK